MYDDFVSTGSSACAMQNYETSYYDVIIESIKLKLLAMILKSDIVKLISIDRERYYCRKLQQTQTARIT